MSSPERKGTDQTPKTRHEQIAARFRQFHKRNPEVWRLFVRFTQEKIAAGHKHYSAMLVIARIRWESPAGETSQDRFKINDHFAPLYARAFEKKYPEHKGFFRSRKLSSKHSPASHRAEFKPSDVMPDSEDSGGNA